MADLRTSLVPNKLLQIVRLYSPRRYSPSRPATRQRRQPVHVPFTPTAVPRQPPASPSPSTSATPSAVKARDTRPSRHGKDRNRGGHGQPFSATSSSPLPLALCLCLSLSRSIEKSLFDGEFVDIDREGSILGFLDTRGGGMYRDNGGKVVALSDRRPGPTCNAGRLLFGFRRWGFPVS